MRKVDDPGTRNVVSTLMFKRELKDVDAGVSTASEEYSPDNSGGEGHVLTHVEKKAKEVEDVESQEAGRS